MRKQNYSSYVPDANCGKFYCDNVHIWGRGDAAAAFFYGRPTYNNNKCADDDIAASNELLEIIGVDLDKGTKANKTGAS